MKSVADHIIFHHVPKTAGTTIYSIVDSSFDGKVFTINGNQTEHEDSVKHFINLPQSEIDKIDLLKGHRTFGLHKFFSGSVKYFTVLRKPAQRHISGYYQLLKVKPELEERIKFIQSPPSLEEYIVQGDIYYGKNPQIKTFLNIPDPSIEVDEDMYQYALKVMKEHFFIIGLTERFDQTCVLLNQVNGFHISHYLKKNVAHNYNPSDISGELIDLYEKNHVYDMRFYSEVEKIFNEDWNNLLNGDKLLRDFQQSNAKWNDYFLKKTKLRSFLRKLIGR